MSAGTTPVRADAVAEAIGRLARLMHPDNEILSPGDRAELRRLNPMGTLPPVAWHLLTDEPVRDAIAVLPWDAEHGERAFAVLLAAMAETGPGDRLTIGAALRGDDPQRRDAYAEDRFVRLLRARGLAETWFEVRLATNWCVAKGRPPRFTDRYRHDGFGAFILRAALADETIAERRAHAIARSYFQTPSPESMP